MVLIIQILKWRMSPRLSAQKFKLFCMTTTPDTMFYTRIIIVDEFFLHFYVYLDGTLPFYRACHSLQLYYGFRNWKWQCRYKRSRSDVNSNRHRYMLKMHGMWWIHNNVNVARDHIGIFYFWNWLFGGFEIEKLWI